MRILHTADWHLGKNIEGYSRIKEQEKFLVNFTEIVEAKNPDLIIIAGDIYDSYNPSAKAEELFYETLKGISGQGERLILVIAGNHDNPQRLEAPGPLAKEHGILMVGIPKTTLPIGKYGKHHLVDAGEGYIEIEINGERSVILLLPYPSEKRLNEVLYDLGKEETENHKSYTQRIYDYFDGLKDKFREDTVNLVTAHLFAMGSEESDSERNIQLGGSYIVDGNCFPQEAHYIALGHIHKPQKVPGTQGKGWYSGSPIHFNRRETNFQKKVLMVEVNVDHGVLIKNEMTEINLPIYKPIEVWKAESIEHAINMCEERKDEDSWVYLEVKTDRYIRDDEIKKMKTWKKDILEVIPKIDFSEKDEIESLNIGEKTFTEIFKEFYRKEKGVEVTTEILELLLKITMGESENETNPSQN
ncbi:MAG: exonuclease SbcCD subunit D [Eubacteriaceae bacterium]